MTSIPNVLLIDDDYATNYLHNIFLEDSGCIEHIHVTRGTDEAIEFLTSLTKPEDIPQFIFLDINLPARDGWEFIMEYDNLSDDIKDASKIIMLSTSENPRDVEKSKTMASVAEYRVKPLSVEIIKELVNKYYPEGT